MLRADSAFYLLAVPEQELAELAGKPAEARDREAAHDPQKPQFVVKRPFDSLKPVLADGLDPGLVLFHYNPGAHKFKVDHERGDQVFADRGVLPEGGCFFPAEGVAGTREIGFVVVGKQPLHVVVPSLKPLEITPLQVDHREGQPVAGRGVLVAVKLDVGVLDESGRGLRLPHQKNISTVTIREI